MIDINTALQNILKAIYGKEVRQSIHDAISQINDNALEAVDLSQIRFGTDITSPTSSVTGYNEGNIYINTTTGIIWRLEGGSWTDKGHLKSIEAINGPVKDGLEDTYEIEFNDGTTHEYKVLNGKGITEIKLKESNVLTDTYTILFNDGTTQDFDVTNGKGISGIAKTSTSGLIDTYTITFSDGTTDTFLVTNGEKGKDAISIVDIEKDTVSGLTTQYKILMSDGSYAPTGFSIKDGKDAVSIKDITLVNTVGTTKIYRIDLTDGSSTATGFTVTDGTSSYLHVRYSATFDGQNMVSTPTKDTPFIGMVVTNQNVAPTDPTVYKWVRFIGQNGTGTGDMLEADYVTLYPATKIVDKAAALWDGSKEIYGSDMLQKTEYATNGEPGIVDKAAELVDLKNQKIAVTEVLANLSEDEDGNLLYKGNKITEVDDALDSNSENTVQNKVVTEAIEQVTERLSDIDEFKILGWNVPKDCPFQNTLGEDTLTQNVGRIVLKNIGNTKMQTNASGYSSFTMLASDVPQLKANIDVFSNKYGLVKYQSFSFGTVNEPSFEIAPSGGKPTIYLALPTESLSDVVLYYQLDTPNTYNKVGDELHEITAKLSAYESGGFVSNNLLIPTLESGTKNNITYTKNADGTYTLNTTSSGASANTWLILAEKVPLKGGTYKVLGKTTWGTPYAQFFNASGTNISNDITEGNTFSSNDIASVSYIVAIYSGIVLNNVVIKPMITPNLNATVEDYQKGSKSNIQLTEEIATIGKIHYLDHTYKFSVDSKGLVILNYPSSLIGKHVFSIFTTKSDGDPCNNIALYEPDVQSSSRFVCYGEAGKSYNSYTFRFAYFD